MEPALTDLFREPDDATPLAPEEREGLLQTWVTHRRDLNEAEQENIVKGAHWARRTRGQTIDALLNIVFARTLHKRMFGDVWRWAGTYRQSERNIGIEAYRIASETTNLFDDARYWVRQETYPPDELGVRLHHRLVAIHPFPNGNSRHDRLMADLLIERFGGDAFSWGGASLADVDALRKHHVAALQAVDDHDIGPLLQFARS